LLFAQNKIKCALGKTEGFLFLGVLLTSEYFYTPSVQQKRLLHQKSINIYKLLLIAFYAEQK